MSLLKEGTIKRIKLGLSSIPLAALALGAGCSKAYDVKFTDCSLDPQTKTEDRKMMDQTISPPMELKVDGITFRASRKNIDVFPNQQDRINVIEQNKAYSFKGLQDGRTYVVTFNRDSDHWLRSTTIVGTCDTQK